MDESPRIARYKPFYAELEEGRTYFWCACGRSERQPFCDGSHKGTGFEPLAYTCESAGEEVLLCGCKRTATAPFCDGTHNSLREAYETDDPLSPQNAAIPQVHGHGAIRLDGRCFVSRPDELRWSRRGNLAWAATITEADGARFQSQFVFDAGPVVAGEAATPVAFGDVHVLLFVAAGAGQVRIGDRVLRAPRHGGVLVLPGEQFALQADGDETLRVFASACPGVARPGFPDAPDARFDDTRPERAVALDRGQRVTMADRFFQILIGREHGCKTATQFIGEIPLSKAAPHRHLYEESLIVVSGRGVMWTDTRKTNVRAGDVIFLPRKLRHSLQCTNAGGMLVAGVIYPGDNPSINY